jgi:hypothetical protein
MSVPQKPSSSLFFTGRKDVVGMDDTQEVLVRLKRSGTFPPSDTFVRQEIPLKPGIFHGRDDLVASAFLPQVGWGRLQFPLQLSNCLSSRIGFHLKFVSGCLALKRLRQVVSSKSFTTSCKYLEISKSHSKTSFPNSMPRNSLVLSYSTTLRHPGMCLMETRNRSRISFVG